MAIEFGGHTWRTLADPLYVNGQLIKEATVNGVKVYPEGYPYELTLHGEFDGEPEPQYPFTSYLSDYDIGSTSLSVSMDMTLKCVVPIGLIILNNGAFAPYYTVDRDNRPEVSVDFKMTSRSSGVPSATYKGVLEGGKLLFDADDYSRLFDFDLEYTGTRKRFGYTFEPIVTEIPEGMTDLSICFYSLEEERYEFNDKVSTYDGLAFRKELVNHSFDPLPFRMRYGRGVHRTVFEYNGVTYTCQNPIRVGQLSSNSYLPLRITSYGLELHFTQLKSSNYEVPTMRW